jgi:hypothetical protein
MTRTFAALTLAFLAGAASTPAMAQVGIDMGKVTCAQYTHGDLEDVVVATAWYSGYINGRKRNTRVDFKRARDNANAVTAYCEKNPQATVLEAARKVVK